ncbi:hypothetical protein [Prosthecobacter sp.]|uniref:hypothetical protein n=1 Tax=Prosthecobacter sp. TaxID=1965333 RepID=UPI002ABCAC2E|nr:hypothetical protein [Prosthecobacter sp.]MDZ4402832.1 hypothetical protein [Prosthecobacter sp.]
MNNATGPIRNIQAQAAMDSHSGKALPKRNHRAEIVMNSVKTPRNALVRGM